MSAPDRTLEGRVVLVTRPEPEARSLIRLLQERGAAALAAPAIRIVPAPVRGLDRALDGLAAGEFDWLVLTSRAGVEALFERLSARGMGPGVIGAPVAAVGAGTARALRERGIQPALVPDTFTTEALGVAMPAGRGRVLLARADIAQGGLEEALARKGWSPVRVDAYRTVPTSRLPADARRALAEGGADAVTFTSASTVDGFLRAAGDAWPPRSGARRPKVVCIGPVTARRARTSGFRVTAVARYHTVEGLVDAVERALVRRPPRGGR